jgi:hypothetical protein
LRRAANQPANFERRAGTRNTGSDEVEESLARIEAELADLRQQLDAG